VDDQCGNITKLRPPPRKKKKKKKKAPQKLGEKKCWLSLEIAKKI
jgi:hypothetical protein